MDGATNEIYSAFLVTEEGTLGSCRGLREVIAKRGLFCELYTDRRGHYPHTAKAGEVVDKDRLTGLRRALAQLGIAYIPAYSPDGRRRSERSVGALRDRLPKELRLARIANFAAATASPRSICPPTTPASR